MTTVWMAVSLGSSDSNDGADIFGVFSTKELAVEELKHHYTEEENIHYEDGIVTFGRILKKDGSFKTFGYAQAFSMEVDKKTRIAL